MKMEEIISTLAQLNLSCTVQEIKSPTQAFVRNIYGQFTTLINLTGVEPEFNGVDRISNAEMVEEGLQEFIWIKQLYYEKNERFSQM